MILKDSTVKIHGIRPELVFALHVADQVYSSFDQELVITSLNDGVHSKTSLHYCGSAADLRIYYFPIPVQKQVVEILLGKLGADFDVVLENDHIHLEYQPKRRY